MAQQLVLNFDPEVKDEDDFAPRHVIVHRMRDTPHRLNAPLAHAFTALTLAPWLGLLWGWRACGANVSLFGGMALRGAVFFAALAASVGLYWCYWAYLGIFDLLRYGSVLAVVTAWAGLHALSQRAKLYVK